MKSRREEVFGAVESELAYQEFRWEAGLRQKPDEEKVLAEWANYIEYQLDRMKERIYMLDDAGALEHLRKLTALGVRAMEVCGAVVRKVDYNSEEKE